MYELIELSTVFDWLDKISIVTGIGGAIFSWLIWLKLRQREKFNEQRITIRLKFKPMTVTLPFAIERKNMTRSELLGLLGLLPMKKKEARYSLAFLNTRPFFDCLKAAQDQKTVQAIEILCTEEELAQFDLDKMREQCTIEETA